MKNAIIGWALVGEYVDLEMHKLAQKKIIHLVLLELLEWLSHED
jgi:hypothetical protein